MLIVVAYDPTWPQRLQAASAEILAVADHLFLRLEHIGSTSVPGLAAKPTIDMMASVRRLLDGHAAQPALAALGYELDELGYVQLDPRGAELLFQIITEREERASIAIGTNLPFSEWGTVFPDPRLVARHRRPDHLQRPHHRDRHPVLPARHQQDQQSQAGQLALEPGLDADH